MFDDDNIIHQKFKILLIGDSNVGKTVFFRRLFNDDISELHLSTIGVEFKTKNVKFQNKEMQLEIWDTAGQERYRSITKNFFKGANGILLFYDITKKESLTNIKTWMKALKDTLKIEDLCIVILGNKIDLDPERDVDEKEGKHLADSFKAEFIETSGKSGNNVNEALMILIRLLSFKAPIVPDDKSIASISYNSHDPSSSHQNKKLCNCG